MKKTIISIISILIGLISFSFADLEFTNYQILGQIQNDGTINVQEHIDAYFFDQMHGIEREIPQSYIVQDSEFQIILDNINVPNDNYIIIDNYYDTTIRIGDANTYIEGEKKYEIDYSIYGLIKNFSGMGYSELYRDIIGYDWNNDIENVEIELTLPKAYTGLTKDDFLISAGYSDKYSIDDFPGEVKRDENKIYITYNHKLESYNGITLAIKFPNGYFDFDHERQENLLIGYTHDFNIKNYKLYGIIEKSGNIKFQNYIELEILNENPSVRAELPYRYEAETPNKDDGKTYLKKYLTQIRDVEINGEKKDISLYDTTNPYSAFIVSGDFTKYNTFSGIYSIYGLIRPFTGEFKDRAYRLYLPLPPLDLFEDIENFELILDVPGGCKTIYKEDISINIYGDIISSDEYNEKYGTIQCKDNKLSMTFNEWMEHGNEFGLYIRFIKGTFELDEELIEALESLGDGKFYYSNKTNRQSILLAIGILLFGGGFKALMDKRYKNQSRMDKKYPIQYDAPKGVDAPEAGVLIDNIIDPKDMTALIYQRAINHYIKIFSEDDKHEKFYIKKLKNLPGTSKKYQINLFNSLFESGDEFHFSNETSKFITALSSCNKDLLNYINEQKRFKTTFFSGIGNGFKTKTGCLVFGVAILGFIPYFAIITAINNHLVPISNRVKIILFIAFVLIVTSYRNYKQETNTATGQEVRDHCLGFRDFLIKVDKEKLETLMKQDPLYIEKVLPYAIVFGVQSKLIKYITPEMIENWDWFEGDFTEFEDTINNMNRYNRTNFIPVDTGSSFNHTTYSSSGGFSSGSSFGGGFSSGGGGGGGGGGGR